MSTFHLRITERENNGGINLNRPDVKTGRIILSSYSFYYKSYVPEFDGGGNVVTGYHEPTTPEEKVAAPRIRELVCNIPFLVASTLSDVRESGQRFHLPVQPDYTGETHTIEHVNLEVVSLEEVIPYFVPVTVSHVESVGLNQPLYNVKNLSDMHIQFVLNLYFTFADNM